MKKIYFLAAVLMVLVAAASCEKNSEISQPQPSGELRQVTIKAGSSQTKTYVEAGTLKWSDDDKLYIAPQSGTVAAAALGIKSGAGTVSGTFEGQIDASIEDDTALYGWCGGSWTYNEGTFSVEMPATQTYVDNGLAENAYPSIGTGAITSGISLSNPMGVLKLSVMGATVNDKVKSVTVTSAANNLAGEFTINPASSYAVTGGSSKTLTLSITSPVALSLTEAVNFYIVLPPAAYAANDLTVKITFSDDTYLNYYLTEAASVTKVNATAIEISDHTGRRGTLSGQEYVMIRAKYDGTNDSYLKWATQNLAVTASGKAKWKGTNYQIGDYFQWGASYAGYGITEEAQKNPANLVIYDSFTNTCAGGSSDSFSFKTGKANGFKKDSNAPYCDGTNYTKYNDDDKSTRPKLELSDDVANIVLGDTWRMPTGDNGESNAMCAVTYWAFDATDMGFYVFKPGVGTSGAANAYANIAVTDDKTKALLFFPLVGYGEDANLKSVGNSGDYWESLLNIIEPAPYGTINRAYALTCSGGGFLYVSAYGTFARYSGKSVRPVSD